MRPFFLILLISLINFSCKRAQVSESYKEKTISKKAGEQKNAYHASNTRKYDLLHTRLEVSFDWEKQYLYGNAELTIKPYFYTNNQIDIDAKGFEIHNVSLLFEGLEYEPEFKYDGSKLNIQFDREYSREDTFLVNINYTARPEELPLGGSKAITSDKGLYFINPLGENPSKPSQIWTQGETEASSKWFPTIDSPNERCTQEIFITVDTTYTALSNGELMYTINNGDGTNTTYWKLDKPHAPYLFMMAIGKYAVVRDSLENLEFTYYVEPEYEPYAKDIFGNTPEMVRFFSEKLDYPFPWSKYAQVVVRDYVSGAMENTSATIFMEDLQSDDRELLDENWDGIIAHELFHQWFGNLVTCESWSNLPLNESFANYSEYLWAEYKYGKNEADFLGQKELAGYFAESTRKQEPLIRYHYHDKEDMFDMHSYNKGGRILHMLRKYVGDDAFYKSLNLYLTKNEFKSVEVHHLRLAFEEVTGEDLNWFFNQWFMSPGHPNISAEHSFDGKDLVLKLSQKPEKNETPVYKLPIEVDVWVKGQKQTHSLWFDTLQKKYKIPVTENPELVVIDPNFVLLAKIQHEKNKLELLTQYYKYDDNYLARSQALKYIFTPEVKVINGYNKNYDDIATKKILADALNDSFWAVRLQALEQFSLYFIPEISSYVSIMEKMSLEDTNPAVRTRAINLLASFAPQKFKHVFLEGLKAKPYSVAAASLNACLANNLSEIKIENFIESKNIYISINLGDYFINIKDQTRYVWFKERLLSGKSGHLYPLIEMFGKYAFICANEEEKEDAIVVLNNLLKTTQHEEIKSLVQSYSKKLKL